MTGSPAQDVQRWQFAFNILNGGLFYHLDAVNGINTHIADGGRQGLQAFEKVVQRAALPQLQVGGQCSFPRDFGRQGADQAIAQQEVLPYTRSGKDQQCHHTGSADDHEVDAAGDSQWIAPLPLPLPVSD